MTMEAILDLEFAANEEQAGIDFAPTWICICGINQKIQNPDGSWTTCC